MGISTAASEKNLLNATSIRDFLEKNRENMLDMKLSDYLSLLLSEKDLRVADVIRDSGLGKSYVHQIFNGEKNPSRDKLIAIAFGLHLTADETQRMLKLGGCSELFARVAWDAVILFAINHGKKIDEAERLLYDNGFPTLYAQDR